MSVASLGRREGPKLGNWGLTPLQRHKRKSLKTARLAGLCMMVLAYLYMYAANITPAGTYFNLKLAMLLSLVADALEVWRCAVAFTSRYNMISCGKLHLIPDQHSRCVLYSIADKPVFTACPHCLQCRPLYYLEGFCLFVCPSLTFWCFVPTNEDTILQFQHQVGRYY